MYLLTKQRGASNRAAKDRLQWKAKYPTWRDGFRASLKAHSFSGQPLS